MNTEQGKAFLHALGCKKIQQTTGWVQASCPLAPWRHQKATDSNPSFGLSVSKDKRSFYNCYACGGGSALSLLSDLEYLKAPANFKLAREILESEELEVVPLPDFGEFEVSEEQWRFTPWPEYWIEQYPLAESYATARDYLLSRKMTPEQMGRFDIRFDPDRFMVVFPIRDAYGQLAGARGRSIDPTAEGGHKHHDYGTKNQGNTNVKGVWLNEQSLHLPGWVIVVEGQFDMTLVERSHKKVVANLTAKPTVEKMRKLAHADGVLLIPDNDLTGAQSIAKYQARAADAGVPDFRVLQLPPSVKDANECHPDYIRDQIAELALW